jgi:hypothetical protein
MRTVDDLDLRHHRRSISGLTACRDNFEIIPWIYDDPIDAMRPPTTDRMAALRSVMIAEQHDAPVAMGSGA